MSFTEPEPQPRWPLYYAWVTSWVYPATTARKTAHVVMWKIWLFHVCTLFMIATTICVIVAAAESNPLNLLHIYLRTIDNLNDIVIEYQRHPYDTLGIFILSFLGIELFFFLLAFLTMAWGARDEALKASLRHALCRIWIGSACILPALISVSIVAIFMDQDYLFVRYNEFIAPLFGFIAGLWFVWALLQGLGAYRNVQPVDRPPLCEFCGYNLTTMPMESRCPECGKYVIKSLGPDVRRGTAWEKQDEKNRLFAWKECFTEPILRPKEFGRQLQVTQYLTAHRFYLFHNLPIIFAVGMISILVGFIVTNGWHRLTQETPEFLFVATMFGCACVIGTVTVTLFGGWLIGWGHSVKHKRNLMPVSIQAACYLSGYLILWAIFGALNGLFVYWGYEYRIFQSIRDITGMYVDTIATLFWFVPNVTCGIYYLLLIARTTSGAWYANR